MAKKKKRKLSASTNAMAAKAAGKKLTPAMRLKVFKIRAKLHDAATMLKDFHGGKLPVRSGCGRPRGS
jgi:hypothetical protein